MTFTKKTLFKILIVIIISLLAGGATWYLWNFYQDQQIIKMISKWQAVGYRQEITKTEKENLEISYNPKEHKDQHVQRVVDNVAVLIKTYLTPEEAQKKIEEASLVYIWEWRKEEILGHQFEVSTGFLFNPQERRYTAAYLAWSEGPIYYEFIATPSDIRKYSDKEFLYQSAKEVAEGILSK